MNDRFVFDVYGRFRVIADRTADGRWTLYRESTDGKRRRVSEVWVERAAGVDEVIRQLEAARHEYGTPGAIIRRVDLPDDRTV